MYGGGEIVLESNQLYEQGDRIELDQIDVLNDQENED